MLYRKEITIIPSRPVDVHDVYNNISNEWTDNVNLEVTYDSKTCEYRALLKVGKNDMYSEYQIFYFKAPYEHKYGLVNLREVFKNNQLNFSMYISDKYKDIDLMNIIIQLFETIQTEIMIDKTTNTTNNFSKNGKDNVEI